MKTDTDLAQDRSVDVLAAERAFWETVKAPVLTQTDYDAARKKWADALRRAEAGDQSLGRTR